MSWPNGLIHYMSRMTQLRLVCVCRILLYSPNKKPQCFLLIHHGTTPASNIESQLHLP